MESLNDIFFYTLEKSIKAYRQYAQARLREKGFHITIDQWLVLRAIAETSNQQGDIASMVFKDKAPVTRIVDLLIMKKLATRLPHDQDRRRSHLSITAKGVELLEELKPHILENRAQALSGIKSSDLQVTESVLKRISSNCPKTELQNQIQTI